MKRKPVSLEPAATSRKKSTNGRESAEKTKERQ